MVPRFMTPHSLFATFSLCCVPVIHAAALISSAGTALGSASSVAQVARSWPRSLIGAATLGAEDYNTISADASYVTAYLRIASLSIALYDVLMTVPDEFRLYASQPSFGEMSRACILFIGVRYTSIAAIVASNFGFFATGFTQSLCAQYHLVAPLLKVFAVSFSQLILSVRTCAISRKESWVFYTLCTLFVLCTILELFGNLWERVPVQNQFGNCQSGNNKAKVLWIHYLAAMIFDMVALGISTTYLVIQANTFTLTSGLSRLMLKEGMVYLVLLTSVNVLNLILFRYASIAAQSSAASLGMAVTMIMSQHIILNLHGRRGMSLGAHSSNHEMVPVSIVSTNAGAAGRSRNFGTNRAPSRAFSPASGGPGYVNGTVSPITFDGGSGRRSMKQGGPPLSAVREFGYPEMEPDEGKHDSPLEIRVQVQEEVKSDYDSAYAGPDVRGNDTDRKWAYV